MAGAATGQDAAATPLPNVVYVLADDLGYGELGCYGQAKIATPNLDRLAAEGMRFTQHYAGAPVCAPSRCVLMTGKHSGHATIRDNLEHQPEGQAPILDADATIAELLAARGYATGCFGKWGLGFPGGEGDPRRQGFGRFYGYNCQRHAHGYYPRYLRSDDRKVELVGNDGGRTGKQYAPDLIVEQALSFIREHAGRPFFCYLPLPLPHLALQVPEASLAEYRDRWPETPYEGKSYQPHDTPRAAYAAMVSHLDRCVGEVVDLLRELGLEERTLVIFSSDNGATHLREQVDAEFFASSGPLRGLKGSLYEGGIRVPMLARWRGKIRRGAVSDYVSSFADVLPTLCELSGATPPADTDGLSFLPTLLGRPAEQKLHDHLLWDFPGYGGQLAVRQGQWKAVRHGLRQRPDAPLELYDLIADPGETTDLAAAQPQIAERLAALLVSGRREPVYPQFRFGDYPRR